MTIAAKDAKEKFLSIFLFSYIIKYIPMEELNKKMYKEIWNHWQNLYLLETNVKGTSYRNLINGIWFFNTDFNSSLIKQINRLRSNHCFDKKNTTYDENKN